MKKMFDAVVNYLKSIKGEIKRITWPSRKELTAATIVVLITLVIVTSFLALSNFVLSGVFTKMHQMIKG